VPLLLGITACALDFLLQLRECAARGGELALHGTHAQRHAGLCFADFALEIFDRLPPRLLPILEHARKLMSARGAG
jgi:hypothetical protein